MMDVIRNDSYHHFVWSVDGRSSKEDDYDNKMRLF